MSDLNPTFFKSDLDFCDYAYNDLKIPWYIHIVNNMTL